MKTRNYCGKDFKVLELDDILKAEKLSNNVTVADWPYGRTKRCAMEFSIETKGDKQRMVKQSVFNGRPNKPKTTTYASRVFLIKIDEKIGRVEFAKNYLMVSVHMEDSSYDSVTFHSEEKFRILADHFMS